jgi:hypothetical protein
VRDRQREREVVSDDPHSGQTKRGGVGVGVNSWAETSRESVEKYLGPDAGHGRSEDAFEDEEAEVNLGSSPVGESTCSMGE